MYEKLDPEDQEPEDEEMLNHIQTLLQELKNAGVPDPPVEDGKSSNGADGTEEWEDVSDEGDTEMS